MTSEAANQTTIFSADCCCLIDDCLQSTLPIFFELLELASQNLLHMFPVEAFSQLRPLIYSGLSAGLAHAGPNKGMIDKETTVHHLNVNNLGQSCKS
jgi:hypothetical protein